MKYWTALLVSVSLVLSLGCAATAVTRRTAPATHPSLFVELIEMPEEVILGQQFSAAIRTMPGNTCWLAIGYPDAKGRWRYYELERIETDPGGYCTWRYPVPQEVIPGPAALQVGVHSSLGSSGGAPYKFCVKECEDCEKKCPAYFPTRVPTLESDFSVEDLLLDASAFPEGWEAQPPFEMRYPIIGGPKVGEAEAWVQLGRSFYGYETIANQSVYGYYNKVRSAEGFEHLSRRFFSSNDFISGWEIPSELQYRSPYADQFRLACAAASSNQVCQALGQYDKYVIQLYVPMAPLTNVDDADLQRILATMEERLVSHLELEPRDP